MTLCLFEDDSVRRFEPLALTRHVSDLRLGMFTLAERAHRTFRPEHLAFHARRAVADVTAQEHPGAAVNRLPAGRGVLLVNGRLIVEPGPLLDRLRAAAMPGEPARAFRQGETLVAAWLPSPPVALLAHERLGWAHLGAVEEEAVEGARLVERLWDLLDVEAQLHRDVEVLAADGRAPGIDGRIHQGAHLAGDAFWIAEGAEVRPGAVLSALDGPVVLEAGAVVEEQAVLRGPCWIGQGSRVLAAGRVDGSAVGPRSKVGGEVHASVVHSFSNKAHDGYLGNSYLGRWCNLGADTNTSNLKNDYGEVSLFDPVEQRFVGTGRQFAGLVMADHAKCAINSMFNTGTVVGVFCNLFGSGFPPRHVPSFAWGGDDGLQTYRLDKALRVAEAVMARRGHELSEADRHMLEAAYRHTAPLRADFGT